MYLIHLITQQVNQMIRFEITLTFVDPIHKLSEDDIMETDLQFEDKFINGEYMCNFLNILTSKLKFTGYNANGLDQLDYNCGN